MTTHSGTTLSTGFTHLRKLAWLWLVALPLMPLLACWLGAGFLPGRSRVFLGVLLVVGLALATGLPGFLAWLGQPTRKEIGQVRGVWLVSIFVSQVFLLPFLAVGGPEAVLVFGVTAAVIAAVPFGLEFQQGTLPGLLAQPMAREAWWNRKMAVLAVALAMHWAVFALATLAVPGVAGPEAVWTALGLACLALATTPWWTLRTRGWLTGLVLSMAVPLAAVLVGNLVLGGLFRRDDVGSWMEAIEVTDVGVGRVVAVLLGGGYAVLGFTGARRRWKALEASEAAGEEGWGTRSGGWLAVGRAGPGRRRGRGAAWRRLLVKELRLQGLTLGVAGVAMVLAVVHALIDTPGIVAEVVKAGMALSAVTAVTLAGAVPMAEERRLGTLEAQAVGPVSWRCQAGIKVAVAVAVALAMAGVLFLASSTTSRSPAQRLGEAMSVALLVLGLFAPALLASSGSPHVLRAVLLSLGVAAVVGVLMGVAIAVTGEISQTAFEGVYRSARSAPDEWKRVAASLSDEEWAALGSARIEHHELRVWVIRGLPAIPGLLALYFAVRNLARPGDAPRRMRAQMAVCVGLLAVLMAGWSAASVRGVRSVARADALGAARWIVALERNLSPAERQLWERHQRGPFEAFLTVPVEVREAGGMSRVEPRSFRVPLDVPSRRYLVHRGELAEDLREALRREGLANGEDLSAPPADATPEPSLPRRALAPEGPVQRELLHRSPGWMMRRYGLLPAGDLPLAPTNAPSPGP